MTDDQLEQRIRDLPVPTASPEMQLRWLVAANVERQRVVVHRERRVWGMVAVSGWVATAVSVALMWRPEKPLPIQPNTPVHVESIDDIEPDELVDEALAVDTPAWMRRPRLIRNQDFVKSRQTALPEMFLPSRIP